jgi:hypothetical protein
MAIDALAQLGPSPIDLTRKGSSTVLQGNGLVLKMGPPDRVAREAFLLGELDLPLQTPALVDSGDGWLLLRSVEDVEPSDLALADLARLHDAFTVSPVLGDERLRDVTGRELPALLERAADFEPPEPFSGLIADPSPLLAELNGPSTLVHGDAWPGNVLGTYWIDWEEAGAGHPALDLANWLYGSPWVPARTDPERDLALYLTARGSDRYRRLRAGRRRGLRLAFHPARPAWHLRLGRESSAGGGHPARRKSSSATRRG